MGIIKVNAFHDDTTAEEKYQFNEKYIFRIIFYVSLITNDKQTKKGKEINIFKSLARSNVFSTKSEEQEVNLVMYSQF
jgi:hypothetical protein